MSDTSMVHVFPSEFAKASRVIADRDRALDDKPIVDL